MRALGFAIAFGVLLGGGVAWYHARGNADDAGVRPQTTPAPRAIAVTDLPVPESRSLDAVAAYRAALQESRDGAAFPAIASLRRAVAFDPTMAAAWLRLARILTVKGELGPARDAYAKATALRGLLAERDLGVLSAHEPTLVWTVPDTGEARRRFEVLARRFPLDAELQSSVGYYALLGGDLVAAREAISRSTELDPNYASAWMLFGWIAEMQDDGPSARAAYSQCTAIAPAATECILRLGLLASVAGECAELARVGDRLVAVAPNDDTGSKFAAIAIAAGNTRGELVRDLVAKWTELLSSPIEKRVVLARLDVWNGDFDAAGKRLAIGEAAMAKLAREERGLVAQLRADALLETGRLSDAGTFAKQSLSQDGEQVDGMISIRVRQDTTPGLLAVAHRAGVISDRESSTRREAWRSQWRSRAVATADEREIWLPLALTASSASEAEDSLASRPSILPNRLVYTSGDRALGIVLFLAGRIDEAIAPLSREAASCSGLLTPIEHVRARFMLGQALEHHGDTAAACAAYAFVDARWGHARPLSVTADAAKARATALHCGRVTP